MAGYRFLRFPDGKAKAVTFSYDDGNLSDIKTAEILDKHGMKGTFNIIDQAIGANAGLMTEEDIRTHILEKGHELACHGYRHIAPGKQRAIGGIKNILACRMGLEKRFGRLVRGFAYPDSGITAFSNGADYATIRQYLKALDIAYARSLGGDNDRFELPTDVYNWIPTAHQLNPDIFEYAESFSRPVESLYVSSKAPKLFYVWGHSFEFDTVGLELLERICSALEGDDIWYATNIEIISYINAYNSLIFSADEQTVYNPTLFDIWFEDFGENAAGLVRVASGQTLRLS